MKITWWLICYKRSGQKTQTITLSVCTQLERIVQKGGEERQRYTFPCILYNALKLIRRAFKEAREDTRYSLKKMFKFINQILTAYQAIDRELGIRMYLDAAMAADECGYPTAVYGFLKQLWTYTRMLVIQKSRFAQCKA
eukprot:UN04439